MSWKVIAAALFCLPLTAGVGAQDYKGKDEKKGQEGKMPSWQPGKEHQLLKQFEGEWDFKSKCTIPGEEAREGQGTESVRLTYGGFWLDIEDKGTTMGKDFSGRGLFGYDPVKKKYTGVWVDNMTPFIGAFEGEADSTGKVFTYRMKEDPSKMKGESKDGKGADTPTMDRLVFEIKDQDHRTLRFYGKDPSGKEGMLSEITYTRKPIMVK